MPEIFIDGNVGLHGNPLLFPGPAQFNNDLKDALFFLTMSYQQNLQLSGIGSEWEK